jgi:protein disulfide-isomerase
MRGFQLSALIVALFFGATTSQAQIQWQTDLKSAHQQAQATGKLMLVHFYSDNCVWCDRLEAGAFANPSVAAAIQQQFIPVKVHAGQSPKIASHFSVSQWPTDVIVDASGTVHGRSVSPQGPSEFVGMLDKSLAHAGKGTTSTQNIAQVPPSQTKAPTAEVPAGRPSVSAVTASHQSPGMSLPTSPDLAPVAEVQTNSAPPVALEGFCSVTIVEKDQWQPGERKFGVIHMGQTFLFTSEEAQRKFLAEPFRFAPVLSGMDVVHYFDGKAEVAGKRELSCKWRDRVYLFADQSTFDRFYANYDHYAQVIDRLEARVAQTAASAPAYR